MRKIFMFFSALLLIGLAFSITNAASSGACSGHDGVDCSTGPDSDGSVICSDGWTDSSVMYKDIRDVCTDEFKPFSDMNESHINYEAIISLYERGVIGGYPDFTFKPDNFVNRAEFLKILVEGAGITPDSEVYKECFPDVVDEWFAPYVCYALDQKWVEGYPDGNFQPVNTVNKVEAIKMLMEVQGFDVPDEVDEAPYDDVDVDAWYAGYVTTAKEKGLLEEMGDMLSPGDDMTRASISEMTYRAIIVNEEGLESFEDYITDEEEMVEEENNEAEIEISTIMLDLFWTNWDSDAEDDGIRVSAYFKDSNEVQVYPETQDWTVNVDVYNAVYNDSFEREKTDLVYSQEFAGEEVMYEDILNRPFVRVPKEEIVGAEDEYGWVEATFTSPSYGEYSAISDFTRISDSI